MDNKIFNLLKLLTFTGEKCFVKAFLKEFLLLNINYWVITQLLHKYK